MAIMRRNKIKISVCLPPADLYSAELIARERGVTLSEILRDGLRLLLSEAADQALLGR